MKKILCFTVMVFVSIGLYSQTTVVAGMSGTQVRSAINGNFTTLWGERDTIATRSGYNLIYGYRYTKTTHVAGESGFYNTSIGLLSGLNNTTGNSNTSIGYNALNTGTTGYGNTVIGRDALADADGAYVTAVGVGACRRAGGIYNIGIGYLASFGASGSTGYENIGIGVYSMVSFTGGRYNIGIGSNTLKYTTTGEGNIGIGYSALKANISGFGSIGIGTNVLYNATTGVNVAIGEGALQAIVTGTGNLGLGLGAGSYETGSNKLYIDNSYRASEADGRLKALIYGVFDADTTNQKVDVNAHLFSSDITVAVSDTTVTAQKGRIVFKSTDSHFYGCVATTGKKWKQLDN